VATINCPEVESVEVDVEFVGGSRRGSRSRRFRKSIIGHGLGKAKKGGARTEGHAARCCALEVRRLWIHASSRLGCSEESKTPGNRTTQVGIRHAHLEEEADDDL